MSNYIDLKYLNQISPQLPLFKRKSDNLYNFRCPFCGDSQKSLTKARGYVMLKDSSYLFKCHNCGIGTSLAGLIKQVNPQAYSEYVTEKFLQGKKRTPIAVKYSKDITKIWKPAFLKSTPFNEVKKISQLSADHPAKKYVIRRKIPNVFHHKLFYVPKFFAFVNKFIPNKYSNIEKDEPRLVIPFLDSNQNLFGFQGRAFGNSSQRYITTILNEDAPKIFGLDALNWKLPIFVLEGPIDSMFVNNAIAMAGADLKGTDIFNDIELTFIYDNEPRNKDIIRRMEKVIMQGHNIVIWPNYVNEKDINDMILANRDVEEIQAIISNNTFNGLSAKARLSEWRKI
jgi:transcription elongation factor Elf1